MAQVLDEMVVRLVGDSSSYNQMLDKATNNSQKAAAQISAAGGKISPSFEQAKKSVDLVTRFGGVPGEAIGSIMQMTEGIGLAGKGVGALTTAFGAVKGAIAATGIGLLVVGIAGVVSWISNLSTESGKAKKAAQDAFGSMLDGSKNARQALADVRINTLTEGFKEAAAAANPGFWGRAWNFITGRSAQQNVSRAIDTTIERARAAQAQMRQMLADPRMQQMQRQVATERAVAGASDQAATMQQEVARLGMAEDASKRYALAQQLAANANISVAEASRVLAPQLAQMERAQRQISAQNVANNARNLEQQVARLGMASDASERYSMAQEHATRSGISMEEALRELGPSLERVRVAQGRMAAQESVDIAKGLEQQVARLGMSEDAANRYALAQQFAARTGVSMEQALNTIGPQLDRIRVAQEQIAAQKVWEETRTPQEQFQKRLEELNTLLDNGRISWQTYSRAVGKAEKDTLGAAGATEKFNAASAGSAEAVSRVNDYLAKNSRVQDRIRGMRTAPGQGGSPAGATTPSAATLSPVLGQAMSEGGAAPGQPTPSASPAAAMAQGGNIRTNELLTMIEGHLNEIKRRPQNTLAPAGL